MAAPYRRFVALGDSQTEGLNDRDERGTPVGWADRLAAALASTTSPRLQYANLAVRGARAADVHDEQLPAALRLEPDLATVAVGMNDVLRHDYDRDRTLALIEHTFATLRATGCQVATMTFPDLATVLPVLRRLRPRELALNAGIKAAAERHGVALLDLFPVPACTERRMWSSDRIHASSLGHTLLAVGMAALLEVPGAEASWQRAVAECPASLRPRFARLRTASGDARWLATFAFPVLARQLVGARARVAKRPSLMPLVDATESWALAAYDGRPTLLGGAAVAD
jgi:lysophospholipase L1-like esterase